MTAKKNSNRLSAKSLCELFSHIPQQVKPAVKSNTVSFKKILEPAKAVSDVAAAKAVPPREKKAKTTGDQIICVPFPPESTQSEVSKKIPEGKTPLPVNHVSNIRPTIDPRSPMHGETLGKNDSGRTLVTDGPKAKENALAQKSVAVIQPPIEVNTALPKNAKAARPSTESNVASYNVLGNGTVNKFQTVSAQTALSPEVAIAPVSESKVKTPAVKKTATGAEKARTNYQADDTESNSRNITDKQVKSVQPRPDAAYNKQIRESVTSDVTAASPAKTDARVTAAAVTEQFSQPTVSNAGAVNVNASTTATIATANAGANVHDQVVSVAAAASYKIGQKIAINLNPPELGRITIKFEKNGDEVIGRVEVEKSQTKSQIDLNLSQIVQNLQDSGVQLKRLEVVLQEQPVGNQQEFADHAQPEWDGKHQFESEKNYSGVPSILSAGDQFAYSGQSDINFTDKSVNILV